MPKKKNENATPKQQSPDGNKKKGSPNTVHDILEDFEDLQIAKGYKLPVIEIPNITDDIKRQLNQFIISGQIDDLQPFLKGQRINQKNRTVIGLVLLRNKK